MRIDLRTKGFTHDAAYRQPLQDYARKYYEDKFPGVEECIINCEELSYFQLDGKRPPLFQILDNGKKIIINIPQGKYYDNPRNGKVPKAYDQPSVESVWQHLASVFDKIIESQTQ